MFFSCFYEDQDMKKSISIIGTLCVILVLALVVGDNFILSDKTDKQTEQSIEQATMNGGNMMMGGMVTIEDEEVALAATIPTESSEAQPAATEEVVGEQEMVTPEVVEVAEASAKQTGEAAPAEEKVEVPDCLIDGEHTGVWTDCGDYKVMKCSGCSQEVGQKAYDLGNGIYGYYDDAAATLLHSRVNKIRVSCELTADLNDIAKVRALECVTDFSHDDMRTLSECIAKGQADADSAVAAWNASDYHRSILIDPVYYDGGSACLWYDAGGGNMKSVWVLVLD